MCAVPMDIGCNKGIQKVKWNVQAQPNQSDMHLVHVSVFESHEASKEHLHMRVQFLGTSDERFENNMHILQELVGEKIV